jgi:hypothetical protein
MKRAVGERSNKKSAQDFRRMSFIMLHQPVEATAQAPPLWPFEKYHERNNNQSSSVKKRDAVVNRPQINGSQAPLPFF